jgi:amino acid permease
MFPQLSSIVAEVSQTKRLFGLTKNDHLKHLANDIRKYVKKIFGCFNLSKSFFLILRPSHYFLRKHLIKIVHRQKSVKC